MIKRLNPEQARALLDEGRVGRLGCVIDGAPYVVPVNYVVNGDSIYIHSLIGQKIRALRENPRACFQVDDIKADFQWRSVLAFGDYEEIADDQERRWVARRLLTRFPNLTPIEAVPVHDGQSSVIVFRIRIKDISGVGEG
jgi:uncharacterized protein